MKKDKIYKYTMLILIIILIISCILLYYKKNTLKKVNATISYVGENYIIAKDENNQEYSISTKEGYETGDQITFDIKYQKNTSPIKGEISNLKKINEKIDFQIEDTKLQEENSFIKNDQNNSTTSSKSSAKENNQEESNTEQNVIQYAEELNTEVENSSNITNSIKTKFITLVDFLFYEGTIQNKTFKELSNETKLKVLKLAYTIDQKIETKFPDYKEKIKDTSTKTYSNIKTKVITTYLDLSTKVCSTNQSTCQSAKEGLSDMKKSFSLTWSFIKEIKGIGVQKLKNWYEIWRETND